MTNRFNIIVVDAHEIVRHGVRVLLSAEPDLQVVGESRDGTDLLELCRLLAPNLIILEACLNKSNQIELIKKIKTTFNKIDVLVYSSLEESVFAVRALKLGACGFVSKDQPMADLIKAIGVVRKELKYLSPKTLQFLAQWLVDGDQKPPHMSLSDREFETFQLIAAGEKTAEIAIKMNISVKTVSMYRQRALSKIGLRNNAELIAYAINNSLTFDRYERVMS